MGVEGRNGGGAEYKGLDFNTLTDVFRSVLVSWLVLLHTPSSVIKALRNGQLPSGLGGYLLLITAHGFICRVNKESADIHIPSMRPAAHTVLYRMCVFIRRQKITLQGWRNILDWTCVQQVHLDKSVVHLLWNDLMNFTSRAQKDWEIDQV